jgi:hypothetical protein
MESRGIIFLADSQLEWRKESIDIYEDTEGHIMKSPNLTSLFCNQHSVPGRRFSPQLKPEDIIMCYVVGLLNATEGGGRWVWRNGRMINEGKPVSVPFCPQSHIKSPDTELEAPQFEASL